MLGMCSPGHICLALRTSSVKTDVAGHAFHRLRCPQPAELTYVLQRPKTLFLRRASHGRALIVQHRFGRQRFWLSAGETVAIKSVDASSFRSIAQIDQVQDEISVLSGLKHPNIIRLLVGASGAHLLPARDMQLVAGARNNAVSSCWWALIAFSAVCCALLCVAPKGVFSLACKGCAACSSIWGRRLPGCYASIHSEVMDACQRASAASACRRLPWADKGAPPGC